MYEHREKGIPIASVIYKETMFFVHINDQMIRYINIDSSRSNQVQSKKIELGHWDDG